jgi:putative ABC transport system permease protein
MIGHYLLIALRNFRRNPLSTAIKLLALSLGLACFLAAYVYGDFIGRADAHWANAGRIYSIVQYGDAAGAARLRELPATAPHLAKFLRADFPELVVARMAPMGSHEVQAGDRNETLRARAADPDALRIFDLPLIEGDPITALDRPYSAIISADAARRLFGDGPAIGRAMRIADLVDVTVTGVVGEIPSPSSLSMPSAAFELLVTHEVNDDVRAPDFQIEQGPPIRPSEMESWGSPFTFTYVLAPETGFSLRWFNEQLQDFAARRVPPEQGVARFVAEPSDAAIGRLINRRVFSGVSEFSLQGLLYGLGVLVLAVGCFNFANLATAEAVGRAREIGLRKTVGARRGQIVMQTLMETALLALIALVLMLAIIAAVLGAWGDAAALGLGPAAWARPGFWAGIAAILAGACALAGAYPCLVLANIRPMAALRVRRAAAGGRGVRGALIGLQFATASALLAGVFIVVLQNAELRRTGLGLTGDLAVYLETSPLSADIPDAVFRAELLTHPAITGYTMAGFAPFSNSVVSQDDISLSEDEAAPILPAMTRHVSYDYFETVGARIVAGRDFQEDLDLDAGLSGRRAILDVAAVRRLGLTPSEAVGQTVHVSYFATMIVDGALVSRRNRYEATIVGVADRMPHELRASGGANYAYMFYEYPGMEPIVRIARDDVAAGLAHLDAVWARLAPGVPLERRFLDEEFETAFATFNRVTLAFAVLAGAAVCIAAMGLFGMASFVTQRRLREVGVRKTLGASGPRVLGLLLWDFSKPVLIANLIGWPVAWVAAQAYLNLFATRIPLTPWPFLSALAVSLAIAWIAVGGQAWRAARVKPALVLKYD